MTTPTPQDPLTATDPHSPPNEPTHTNLTELAEQLDKARQAFEQATPTGHFRHQIEGYAARLHLAEQDLAQERRNHAGMSRGELDRLRKVEAALVELGAPNHSTRDDPAGPMITWAQKVATERVQLRAELEDFKADQAAALAELIAERDKLTAELATLKAKAVVLPGNWREQVASDMIPGGEETLYERITGRINAWRHGGEYVSQYETLPCRPPQPDTEATKQTAAPSYFAQPCGECGQPLGEHFPKAAGCPTSAATDIAEQAPREPRVGTRVRILRGAYYGFVATVTETPQQLYPDDPGPRIRVKPSCTSETTTPLVSDVEVIAELPPNDIVYEATRYVTSLVLAARGSWPGWAHPDEVPAAVDEALREIKRLRAEATRALRSGSDALANAAARMENGRRELVALLRDHPGGGLVHEPGNWEETLNVVRAHLVHRKLDKEFRTNLVQAVRRWVPAGEPVSDWQMLHLVGQLADQAARWFDAATEKPAATTASAPDSAGPVTFIDERGRAQTYTLDQVLDAVKHSDKGDGNNW
jgi:hypothetical protein